MWTYCSLDGIPSKSTSFFSWFVSRMVLLSKLHKVVLPTWTVYVSTGMCKCICDCVSICVCLMQGYKCFLFVGFFFGPLWVLRLDLSWSNLCHSSNLDHEGGPDTQSFTPWDHAAREGARRLLICCGSQFMSCLLIPHLKRIHYISSFSLQNPGNDSII